jgi:phospholipid transport system transporter-binding protein
MSDARIERDGAFRFHVEGEMTFATAKQLLQQSAAFFDTPQDLEIDLSRVKAADSAGLALLLEWRAMAARQGTRVVIEGLPEAMTSIAHLCRIEPLLQD